MDCLTLVWAPLFGLLDKYGLLDPTPGYSGGCPDDIGCLRGPYMIQKHEMTSNIGPKPFVGVGNYRESIQNSSGDRISRPYGSCGRPQLFPRICIPFVLIKKRQIYMVTISSTFFDIRGILWLTGPPRPHARVTTRELPEGVPM